MSELVKELLRAVGTDECIASLEKDTRDITGDYDGMAFDEDSNSYLIFIGQVGQ